MSNKYLYFQYLFTSTVTFPTGTIISDLQNLNKSRSIEKQLKDRALDILISPAAVMQ